jgi:chromosome segregation ATPase
MFRWKAQSTQPQGTSAASAAKDDGQQSQRSDAEILRLKSAIADLRGGNVQDGQYEAAPAAQSDAKGVEPPPAEKALAEAKAVVAKAETEERAVVQAPAPVQDPAASSDGALKAAQQLMAEQRKAAEALLREVAVLEDRLKNEAQAAQAAVDYDGARERVDKAATLEQQAKELAQTASERHGVLASERKHADNLAANARADAKALRAQLAELEQQLLQRESKASEAAQRENAAEREATEAAERVIACQLATVAAEKEAKEAKERADALKKELPGTTQGFAGITDVQALAVRIAEQATALTRETKSN